MRLRVSSLVSKVLFLAGAFVISSVGAFAASNSISGIDVKQVENGEYSIMLKLDKMANVKKYSEEMDTLNIVINSALPVEDMEITYDNAADLRNVIVQKKNADNTVISLQGKNIQNAKIYTKELSTNLIKENNSFNGYFNIAENKTVILGSLVLVLLFMLNSSKKSKKQNSSTAQVATVKKARRSKKQTINTINKKNKVVAQNIPSINYRINGSFASAQQNMSVPREFVINQYQKEQMRKVG